jgi:hypothetical protein
MGSIFIIWDGGYSDRSVEGAFSTREKAEAFLKRFFPGTSNTCRDIQEFPIDVFEDQEWPPGRSWLITVRPAPPHRPEVGPYNYASLGYQPLTGDPVVLRPDECTRAWESFDYGNVIAWRARFWGTDVEGKAFGEAKLVEERAKLPPGALGQSYTGRKS